MFIIIMSHIDIFNLTYTSSWRNMRLCIGPLIGRAECLAGLTLQPVYILLNLTFTDFDVFIVCGTSEAGNAYSSGTPGSASQT